MSSHDRLPELWPCLQRLNIAPKRGGGMIAARRRRSACVRNSMRSAARCRHCEKHMQRRPVPWRMRGAGRKKLSSKLKRHLAGCGRQRDLVGDPVPLNRFAKSVRVALPFCEEEQPRFRSHRSAVPEQEQEESSGLGR